MGFSAIGAKSGGSRSKHSSSSKKSTAGSSDTPLTMGDLQSFTEPAQSPSKHLQHESCSSSTELATKVCDLHVHCMSVYLYVWYFICR